MVYLKWATHPRRVCRLSEDIGGQGRRHNGGGGRRRGTKYTHAYTIHIQYNIHIYIHTYKYTNIHTHMPLVLLNSMVFYLQILAQRYFICDSPVPLRFGNIRPRDGAPLCRPPTTPQPRTAHAPTPLAARCRPADLVMERRRHGDSSCR